MSSETDFDPPPPYSASPTQGISLKAQVDYAVIVIRDIAQIAAPLSRKLKVDIAAYTRNVHTRDQILSKFQTLTNIVQQFASKAAMLKEVDADTVVSGVLRRKLKICQRAIECSEAGLQEHFQELKKAGLVREGEAREMEEELTAMCGVDMARDYKVGGKLVEYSRAIWIALMG
jgi:hypothetical protein